MKIIHTENPVFRDKIIDLYIETFSTGLSKQYIDHEELTRYIDDFIINGKVLISSEGNQLIGALLYCDLEKDLLFPNEIKNSFDTESCIYIAEIMVSENFRGKGIGTQLLNSFFQTVDKTKYSEAFIRVWDKNIGALNMYKKAGFIEIATIKQTKRNTVGDGFFEMTKIYLHKKLD